MHLMKISINILFIFTHNYKILSIGSYLSMENDIIIPSKQSKPRL